MRSRDHGHQPDSLDLLWDEDNELESLYRLWDDYSGPSSSPGAAVNNAWLRGTVGKLILERAALRFAGKADVAEALRRTPNDPFAQHFDDDVPVAREILKRLDRQVGGATPMDLRHSPEFEECIESIRALWGNQLRSDREFGLNRAAELLGKSRCRLRSAHFIRTHAPSRPGSRLPRSLRRPVVYVRALFDYMRDLPWPTDLPSPISD